MSRPRRLVAVCAFVVTVATGTAAGVGAFTGAGDDGIPLSSVPAGVSVHDVNGRSVFLVRHGDEVTGFLRLSPFQHTALVWCTADDVFLAPAWGETFDRRGRLIRGRWSPRDMDHVGVAVVGSKVRVDVTAVTRGARPTVAGVRDAWTGWLSAHRREPPTDFCSPSLP